MHNESDTINRQVADSILDLVKKEWVYLVIGALFLYALINIHMSGFKAGLVPDLSAPYAYGGDLLFHSWMIERVIEGWLFENVRSGYPFGSSFLDYPGSDSGNHLLLKALGQLGGNFQSALNLYYLLGFVVTYVASYLVLRRLGLSAHFSVVGAVVFDILPFHFQRLPHLFYTWYFIVPFFYYVGFLCFSWRDKKFSTKSALQWMALLFGLLLAACFGVYYALFGVIVVAISGIAGALASKNPRPLFVAALLSGVVILGVSLNLAPSLAYRFTHGPNPEVAQRAPQESEIYGLKLVQMVLPQLGHRERHLAHVAEKYSTSFPLVNENSTAALGLIGTLGLLLLISVIAIRLSGCHVDTSVSLLALIVATLFMFGTIGGFGSIFAIFISPMVRGWNRISVFIGFGAITALLLFLQNTLLRHLPGDKKWAQPIICVVLICVGVLDQISRPNQAERSYYRQAFLDDQAFFAEIERELTTKSAIYQLPYIGFPEVPPVQQLGPYAPLAGFLHSKTLRWSSGGMKGRPGDLFFRALAKEEVQTQIEVIRKLGFSGIYVDKQGYEDGGQQIIAQLTSALGYGPTIQKADGKVVFFKLQDVAPVALDGLTADQIMQRAGYIADQLGVRYEATLAQGIDFARPGLPLFVKNAVGLSQVEPWGRWSDANIAPTVRFDFTSRLPQSFNLVLDLRVFGPNAGSPMRVKVGKSSYEISLPEGQAVLQLPVQDAEDATFIEFYPPRPTSPASLSNNADERKLAVGFRRLSVISE